MNYWLLKSEPTTFSIDHFESLPGKITGWEGVRNYQARNYIRAMQKGDRAFFYHSSCQVPGIVGMVEITRESYPDQTALEPESPYYDPKSTTECPRWYQVDVRLIRKFPEGIPLEHLKVQPALKDWILIKPGNRLSVVPVARHEWDAILSCLR